MSRGGWLEKETAEINIKVSEMTQRWLGFNVDRLSCGWAEGNNHWKSQIKLIPQSAAAWMSQWTCTSIPGHQSTHHHLGTELPMHAGMIRWWLDRNDLWIIFYLHVSEISLPISWSCVYYRTITSPNYAYGPNNWPTERDSLSMLMRMMSGDGSTYNLEISLIRATAIQIRDRFQIQRISRWGFYLFWKLSTIHDTSESSLSRGFAIGQHNMMKFFDVLNSTLLH